MRRSNSHFSKKNWASQTECIINEIQITLLYLQTTITWDDNEIVQTQRYDAFEAVIKRYLNCDGDLVTVNIKPSSLINADKLFLVFTNTNFTFEVLRTTKKIFQRIEL